MITWIGEAEGLVGALILSTSLVVERNILRKIFAPTRAAQKVHVNSGVCLEESLAQLGAFFSGLCRVCWCACTRVLVTA